MIPPHPGPLPASGERELPYQTTCFLLVPSPPEGERVRVRGGSSAVPRSPLTPALSPQAGRGSYGFRGRRLGSPLAPAGGEGQGEGEGLR